jgi:hypothetical protein
MSERLESVADGVADGLTEAAVAEDASVEAEPAGTGAAAKTCAPNRKCPKNPMTTTTVGASRRNLTRVLLTRMAMKSYPGC